MRKAFSLDPIPIRQWEPVCVGGDVSVRRLPRLILLAGTTRYWPNGGMKCSDASSMVSWCDYSAPVSIVPP